MSKETLVSITLTFLLVIILGCGGDKKQWAEGDYSRAAEIKLDIDAVSKAFESAENPQEFEKRVNEIYTGDEVISLYVKNISESKQKVVLYIDNKPQNGEINKGEQVISFNRDFDSDTNKASYTRTGYGPYAYYSQPSPIYYAAMGALTYWALSRSFYSTPMTSYNTIRSSRNNYRSTPAYRNQVNKTSSLNKSFQKNAPKRFKTSSGSWGKKSASKGSWFSGSKKRSSAGRSRGFSRSRGFGGRRSFGGRRR